MSAILRHGLNGERGLAAAIIAQAAKDYLNGTENKRTDAGLFFLSDWYLSLVDWLGLDPTMLPRGVRKMELAELSIGELAKRAKILEDEADQIMAELEKENIGDAERQRLLERLEVVQGHLKAMHGVQQVARRW